MMGSPNEREGSKTSRGGLGKSCLSTLLTSSSMATSEQQQTLESFTAGTTTERVTQTVVVPLETSQRKNAVVKTAIDEFQAMCSYMAAMLPSFQPHDRSPQNPTLYRLLTRAFPADERTVASKVALAASRHVAAAFESRRQRGGDMA